MKQKFPSERMVDLAREIMDARGVQPLDATSCLKLDRAKESARKLADEVIGLDSLANEQANLGHVVVVHEASVSDQASLGGASTDNYESIGLFRTTTGAEDAGKLELESRCAESGHRFDRATGRSLFRVDPVRVAFVVGDGNLHPRLVRIAAMTEVAIHDDASVARRLRLRKQALSKLTEAEREALGVTA